MTKRLAFFTESYVGRRVGDLFILLNKPSFPMKIFNSLEEANKWLKK
jgi:hypothetical protein